MTFTMPSAEIYVPDGKPVEEALARTTCLAVGAHQDDLEIMAYHGIARCFGRDDQWFAGVVASNGAGSPRTGIYGDYTAEQMMQVRRLEQKKAAFVGEFGAVVLLDFESSQVKSPTNVTVGADILKVLRAARPEVVYTHNPADKHETHVGVALKTIQAVRAMPEDERPKQLIGCEVWRNLDWMLDEEKYLMDVSERENIAASLVGVFDSQIVGGKRYDLAATGRRRSNATFFESHGTDEAQAICWGMDLTPLVQDPTLDVAEYTLGFIDRFRADVAKKLKAIGG